MHSASTEAAADVMDACVVEEVDGVDGGGRACPAPCVRWCRWSKPAWRCVGVGLAPRAAQRREQ